MSSKAKKDPLSRYFKDLDEFEVSSGEESDSEDAADLSISHSTVAKTIAQKPEASTTTSPVSDKSSTATKINQAMKDSQHENSNKLPSANECLKSHNSPAFLRLGQPKEVDWEQRVKSLDQPDSQPVDFKTNAVPPPASYESVHDQGTKVVDEHGNKRKRIEDELEDQTTSTKAYKVHKEGDNSPDTG